jgi:hypothetical protein
MQLGRRKKQHMQQKAKASACVLRNPVRIVECSNPAEKSFIHGKIPFTSTFGTPIIGLLYSHEISK